MTIGRVSTSTGYWEYVFAKRLSPICDGQFCHDRRRFQLIHNVRLRRRQVFVRPCVRACGIVG